MDRAFDNERYIELQARQIRRRIDEFGGKLYLEFGGKLFDDFHAARVLPGFRPDVKLRMLESMRDDVEIQIAISAKDIETSKVRSDLGISYDEDLLRLMDVFQERGFFVGGVVITRYANQPAAAAFRARLVGLGVPVSLHFTIAGYPSDIDRIASPEGFGSNDFIETSRPLVVVTAPGPGSGKMATCLSQLYLEHLSGNRCGYAKFETFPVWNLPITHPINIAYEAATADLDDSNIIDPFHLEAHGDAAVNYNRDVESFPVLRALLERILGASPYRSPTDMGVNMVGFAITDDAAARTAARHEIVRRLFHAAEQLRRTGSGAAELDRLELLMQRADIDVDTLPARARAMGRASETGAPAGALVLSDGRMVTGKTSDRLGAASSLLMNALKMVSGVDAERDVIDDAAINPICRLKVDHLRSSNHRLHADETLIALSITSAASEEAARVVEGLSRLEGCDAFFSVIISHADEELYRRLGINVCCEPVFERRTFFHR